MLGERVMKQGKSKQSVKRTLGATERKSKPAKVERLPHYDLSEPDPEELSKANLALHGGQRIRHELEEHHSSGPMLTAGDLDADWQSAEAVGDEAVGGHAPTPDQNIVDEIGRAVGFDTGDG